MEDDDDDDDDFILNEIVIQFTLTVQKVKLEK